MGLISRDYIFNLAFAYILTKEDPNTGKTMGFNPGADDEVII